VRDGLFPIGRRAVPNITHTINSLDTPSRWLPTDAIALILSSWCVSLSNFADHREGLHGHTGLYIIIIRPNLNARSLLRFCRRNGPWRVVSPVSTPRNRKEPFLVRDSVRARIPLPGRHDWVFKRSRSRTPGSPAAPGPGLQETCIHHTAGITARARPCN